MLKIIYEDNHLIAVYKDHGVLLEDLFESVKNFIKERDKKPGNVFIGIIHRLDRPVAGIVLFAKTSKGASRLSEQWRERKVKKVYHAVISGDIQPRKGKLVHYIGREEGQKKVDISDTPVKRFDEAVLTYEFIKKVLGPGGTVCSLVRINLMTGRHHQIRAQFGYIGHPLLGDVKYGSKISFKNHEIALKATDLTFHKATSGDSDIESDEIKLSIEPDLEINKW